jgi:uncharacterized membrane protein
MNLLFWISLLPWVTVYLGDNHALPFPVALYAAVSAAGGLSFFFLRASIARHHQHEPEFQRLNKNMARKNLIALFIYLVAMVVAFIYTPLALVKNPGQSSLLTLFALEIGKVGPASPPRRCATHF